MDKNIVILGGGFGGLQSALKLSKKLEKTSTKNNYNIILVDKHSYHTFTPLLYEIATTSRETAEYEKLKSLVTYEFKELLKNTPVEMVEKEVSYVNLEKNIVDLKGSKMEFDYLVLALGSKVNDFDIEGVDEYGLSLKTFDDAVAIRNDILYEIEEGKEQVDVVIGGGGSTGVEMAGEIKEWASQIEEEGRCEVNVKLIQGGNTILPGFREKIQNIAMDRLQELGVEVETNTFIQEANESQVKAGEGWIDYDVFIWAGGIESSPITKELPLKKNEQGRVHVMNKLECVPSSENMKVKDNIYAIGDIACIKDHETGETAPAVARVAIEQGRIAANNIVEEIKENEDISENPKLKKYQYKEYPYVIPIGGKFAVARVGPIVFSGFLAWVFKGIVELNYFISIMPFWKALKTWLQGLKIFIQNDRLG